MFPTRAALVRTGLLFAGILGATSAQGSSIASYTIVDLGPINLAGSTPQYDPNFVPGSTAGTGWVVNTAGNTAYEFDKSFTPASVAGYSDPSQLKSLKDGNSAGQFVGSEKVLLYQPPAQNQQVPGQMYPQYIAYTQHASLVDSTFTQWTDISKMFSSTGWTLWSADKIDDLGRIVGMGELNGVFHDFLLTPSTLPSPIGVAYPGKFGGDPLPGPPAPTPEPSTLAILGLAVVGFVLRGRRARKPS
jgi:hypothetical protein